MFTQNTPIALHVNYLQQEMTELVVKKSFVINANAAFNLVIESSLDVHACALKPLSSYENFIRITLYKDREEYYKIQLNQQATLTFNDFKFVIQKMCEEICTK